MRIARVFPTKTNMSPIDQDVYFDVPDLFTPQYDEVHISTVFTWDREKALRLAEAWEKIAPVKLGGPAFGDPGSEFTPGLYLKPGVTITSRGCPFNCDFCFVPKREGRIRELAIKPGYIIQDNNLLACSKGHLRRVFSMLKSQKGIIFSGGLDTSFINYALIEDLRGLSIKYLWISYDNEAKKNQTLRALKLLRRYFSIEKLRVYVLVGYDSDNLDKATARLRWIYEQGAMPFIMLYRSDNEKLNQWWADRFFVKEWSRPAIIKANARRRGYKTYNRKSIIEILLKKGVELWQELRKSLNLNTNSRKAV